MSAWTRQRTREEVFACAQSARVACFPVARARDLLDNAQLLARRFYDRLETASGDAVPMPGLPFELETSAGAALPRSRRVRAPALGEANADILQGRLGLSRQALETLRWYGVV
jgi:crotonobetainyl-CoA:carnitine CoA-transferase CaiB-like acyl-CoA transferase